MADKNRPLRAAVLGLGVAGVAAVKNLAEIGFEVVGFERNPYIGGLWTFTTDPKQTSVIKSTRTNISKQSLTFYKSCFTDFPFKEEDSDYPSAADVQRYIEDYANHFSISDKFRLSTRVNSLDRSPDDSRWLVRYTCEDSSTHEEGFDCVLVTTGAEAKPFIPHIEGQEHFKGRILSAQGYKEPADFANKRVVVVGLSNTGGDVAVDAVNVAKKVYLSHRSGARIIQRPPEGEKPYDHTMSRRLQELGAMMSSTFPRLTAKLGSLALDRQMMKAHPEIEPSWRLKSTAPITNSTPIVNDFVISKFASGEITPVHGLQRFLPSSRSDSSSNIELQDGSVLQDIDAVVFCTGYYSDYSICGPLANPCGSTPEWDQSPNAQGLEYPLALFQGIIHTAYPYSLAFSGPFSGHSFSAFGNSDLISMALAQIWSGRFSLPPKEEMERWCMNNYQKSLKQLKAWRVRKVRSDNKELEQFLNAAAGNSVNEKLGWGWEGWKFWWTDYKLFRLVMYGLSSPVVYRLFEGREGGRKRWEGAREEIIRINKKTYIKVKT